MEVLDALQSYIEVLTIKWEEIHIFGSFRVQLSVTVIFLLYYIISAVYNVYGHPLRHYPGPKLLAASRIPIAYATCKGTAVYMLKRLHDKYGPVVRVAPDELSYADSQSWKDIYGSHPGRPKGMRKDVDFIRAFEDEDLPATLLTADETHAAKLRRVFASAFSRQALATHERSIVRYADTLVQKLYESDRRPVNTVDLYKYTLFEIQVNLQMSESLSLLDSPDYAPWVQSQLGFMRAGTTVGALANFPWIKKISVFFMPKIIQAQKKLFSQFLRAKMNLRLSATESKNDIMSKQSDKGLSEADIRANMPILLIAGNDTTSSLLAGLTALLLNNRIVLEKLKRQFRSRFRDGAEIIRAALSDLPFLDACIKETLRIYPGPVGLPRVVPLPGTDISGNWVPGGTRVYNTQYATYRSAANFRDPDSFIPDRWLDDPEGLYSGDNKQAHRPFSTGPQDCIGQEMAYDLTRLIICKMFLHFDLEPGEGVKNWFDGQRAWNIWDKPPLMVKPVPVK